MECHSFVIKMKKILETGKDIILESPRAKEIEEQVKLWEKELEYLQQLTKQTSIMEVTEETIQQYKAELDKIQTNLTYFQKKYQEYLGKRNKIKQSFYKNKMIIEIKNKIEWQKGLHERQRKKKRTKEESNK